MPIYTFWSLFWSYLIDRHPGSVQFRGCLQRTLMKTQRTQYNSNWYKGNNKITTQLKCWLSLQISVDIFPYLDRYHLCLYYLISIYQSTISTVTLFLKRTHILKQMQHKYWLILLNYMWYINNLLVAFEKLWRDTCIIGGILGHVILKLNLMQYRFFLIYLKIICEFHPATHL